MGEQDHSEAIPQSSASSGQSSAPLILEYQKPPPPQKLARAIRRWMLVLAIAAIGVAAICLLNPVFHIDEKLGGGTLGTPFAPIRDPTSRQDAPPEYFAEAMSYLAIFLLMQWFFLSPRGQWRLRLSPAGPPSRRAALAAGFIGMLLSIGLLATLMEIPNWWLRFFAEGDINTPQHFQVMWIVMAIVWAIWTWVFHAYWKGLDRYTGLRKVFRWLVAGTILELLVAAPAHAMILRARGDDCYCERGTWTGVAFGCTAALWLFGPGALLLYMREHRRRKC